MNICSSLGLTLSDPAKEWVCTNGLPVASPDFIGYLIRVTKKESCLVGVDGSIYPASGDIKHPKMTSRRVRKVLKTLMDAGFFSVITDEPFSEFSRNSVLPFTMDNAYVVNTTLIKYKDTFIPDDDAGDIIGVDD